MTDIKLMRADRTPSPPLPRLAAQHAGGGVGRDAFTLVELVMVLVIIVVTSAIAIPRFANTTQNYRASVAAQRVAADLGMAQARANMTSSTITVTFTPGTGRYTISNTPDLKTGASTYSVDLADRPFDATIADTILGGTTTTTGTSTLSFNGFGAPSAGGTITIAARAVKTTVTIDGASGKAKVP